MEKKLLHSDEEYFRYCYDNDIVTISRCGQYCEIEGGIECNEWRQVSDIVYERIEQKPSHYPCILTWSTSCDRENDYYSGIIIYPEDFK